MKTRSQCTPGSRQTLKHFACQPDSLRKTITYAGCPESTTQPSAPKSRRTKAARVLIASAAAPREL